MKERQTCSQKILVTESKCKVTPNGCTISVQLPRAGEGGDAIEKFLEKNIKYIYNTKYAKYVSAVEHYW